MPPTDELADSGLYAFLLLYVCIRLIGMVLTRLGPFGFLLLITFGTAPDVLAETDWRPSYTDGPRRAVDRGAAHLVPLVRPWPTDAEEANAPSWAVRVWVNTTNGRSGGSGSVIEVDERDGSHVATVVTNNHVVADAVQNSNARVMVEFPQGLPAAEARILGTSKYYDLAFLEAVAPESVLPLQLAAKAPEPQERLSIFGYGANRQGFLRQSGVLVDFAKRSAQDSDPPDFVVGGAQARSGDSGGAVLNDQSGELVGVLWGSTPNATYAIDCDTVHQVATEILGRELACGPFGCDPNPFGNGRPQPPPPRGPPAVLPKCPCNPADLKRLEAEIAALKEELKALHEALSKLNCPKPPEPEPAPEPNPPDAPEKPCDKCPHCEDGTCGGDDCKCDPEALKKQITQLTQDLTALEQKKLTVQILDEHGRVRQQTQTPLGGTLQLQLKPVRP